MTFIEQVGATGTSVQTGVNRFGDYSQTSLDPDGLTFWHTGEYISAGRKTRIFSFRIAGAAGVDEQVIGEIKVFQDGMDLIVDAHSLLNDRETHVDLFDIQGRTISEKVVLPVQSAFNTSINVSGLAAGPYLVRIGNEHYQRVIKVMVQ